MSPQEGSVSIHATNFSGLTNGETMKEARDKFFPNGEVFFGVVENSIGRGRELLITVIADKTRTTIGMNAILAHALPFAPQ